MSIDHPARGRPGDQVVAIVLEHPLLTDYEIGKAFPLYQQERSSRVDETHAA